MSSFEITGTVLNGSEKTSAQGKPYFVFQIQDSGKHIFDMALFGSSASLQEKVEIGKKISVKGALQSRTYKDKNGVERFNTSLQPQWIEAVGKPAANTRTVAASTENSDLDDLPF